MLRDTQSPVEQELTNWRKVTTSITSSNEDVYRLFRQSVEEMAALHLWERTEARNGFIPAAGVPWFLAVFGRDSVIVSLQNLMVYPDFARGALGMLGKLQASEVDDYRDAQPGKIPHQIRVGERAERKLIPVSQTLVERYRRDSDLPWGVLEEAEKYWKASSYKMSSRSNEICFKNPRDVEKVLRLFVLVPTKTLLQATPLSETGQILEQSMQEFVRNNAAAFDAFHCLLGSVCS